jgi:predicted ester cyclase
MGRHVPYRIEVGKMVERWAKWDKAELLEQIGFIPAS